jgi:hypothetical protein
MLSPLRASIIVLASLAQLISSLELGPDYHYEIEGTTSFIYHQNHAFLKSFD